MLSISQGVEREDRKSPKISHKPLCSKAYYKKKIFHSPHLLASEKTSLEKLKTMVLCKKWSYFLLPLEFFVCS